MQKQTDSPVAREEGVPAEPVMSIEDFADYGLEPGQKALLWDFATRRYVTVMKSAQPTLARIMVPALFAAATAVHSFAVIALTGGVIQ